jgi:anoctamin-10/anoctamin-7
MRRAEPRSAEDIGTWQAILEVTSIFAIFINSGLVAFTATNLVNYTWPMRVWTFILMSGGIFALRGFVAFLIPDTPEWVDIQVIK